MLTSIEEVKEWITDNGFKRWVLYKDFTKSEKIIDSNGFPVADMADKLAMTEKYLRRMGGRAYAAGATSNATSDLNIVAEIRLDEAQAQAQGASGVGGYPNIGELRSELTETITKQLRAEMQMEDMKRREKDLEQREKDFNEKQNSVIGALVGIFSPYIPVLNSMHGKRMVAGTPADAAAPVHVQPIIPEEPGETQEQQPASPWDDFTEEEADELIGLIARFKKIEPDYMKLLASVVEMAERGDSTYTMAKGFLVK